MPFPFNRHVCNKNDRIVTISQQITSHSYLWSLLSSRAGLLPHHTLPNQSPVMRLLPTTPKDTP